MYQPPTSTGLSWESCIIIQPIFKYSCDINLSPYENPFISQTVWKWNVTPIIVATQLLKWLRLLYCIHDDWQGPCFLWTYPLQCRILLRKLTRTYSLYNGFVFGFVIILVALLKFGIFFYHMNKSDTVLASRTYVWSNVLHIPTWYHEKKSIEIIAIDGWR